MFIFIDDDNPLKYWDPLGLWVEVNAESGFTKFSGSDNTVHYLLNIDGAKTFGHAAMLIVNQEGEGLFYSYMASDSLWKVIGGVKSKSVMAELYGTAEDVQNLLRTGNVNFTTDTYIVDDNYDRTISKGVNFNDVIELLGVANSFKGKPYDTYNNNCGTFVMDALSKIDSTMRNEERYSFPNVQYVNMINSIQETWDISSIGSDTTKESIVLRTYIGTYINKTVRSLSMPMLNLHY